MLWREKCQSAVMLLGISILMLFISVIGFQSVDNGIKHLYRVQTSYSVAKTSLVNADTTIGQPVKQNARNDRKAIATNAQPLAVSAMAPVRASDIIKGKANDKASQVPAKTKQTVRTQPSSIDQSKPSKPQVQNSTTDSLTSGLLVERAGVGMGILLKKGARNVFDHLLHILETTKIQ